MELISNLQPWHWLVLALGLFALEVFATTEFFIGIAVASLLMSVLLWLWPEMAWEMQLTVFGLGSVLFTLAYFKFLRGVNEATDSPLLNDRAAQLIGTRFTLQDELNEKGAVMISDTRWQARCEGSLAAGEVVEVMDSEGMVLTVKRVAT